MNRKSIKQQANDLRLSSKLISFPVNVTEIAYSLGINVWPGQLEDNLSGFAYQKAGNRIIGVNSEESNERQRFTIAHELGHMILHKQQPVNYDRAMMLMRDGRSSDGTHTQEIQANKFAAELLMPETEMYKDISSLDLPDLLSDHPEVSHDFQFLCSKYGVSSAAMKVRLSTLYF